MERDDHKGTFLMGEERLFYLCPSCGYAVRDEVDDYRRSRSKVATKK